MKLMEENKYFVVKDPSKAHLFYLPFSARMLEHSLYVRNSHNRTNLRQFLKDYTDKISTKYPHFNRTGGADHFLVACHDWVCCVFFIFFLLNSTCTGTMDCSSLQTYLNLFSYKIFTFLNIRVNVATFLWSSSCSKIITHILSVLLSYIIFSFHLYFVYINISAYQKCAFVA